MSAPVRLPVRASVEATYTTFFKAPIAFTLVAMVPFGAFQLLLMFAVAQASEMIENGSDRRLEIAAAILLTYSVFIFCLGVLLFGAFRVTRGRGFSLVAALARGWRRLLSMILAALPLFVAGCLFSSGMAVPFSGLGMPSVGPSFLLASLVLALINAAFFGLALPVCLIEQYGPLASLKRSVALTRGSRWRLLGCTLLVMLPIYIATWIIRAFGNEIVATAAMYLTTALHLAAVSILGVIALRALARPQTEVAEVFG